MTRVYTFGLALLAGFLSPTAFAVDQQSIREAVQRSLPLLERTAKGSSDQRKCFTCHGQAIPVFAATEAMKRGFQANSSQLSHQVAHTLAHLKRGRKSYQEGKGQGGRVDMAGYALWTLEEGEASPDDTTQLVAKYILDQQNDDGFWKHTSNRPPSEASDFTTTYVALRAIGKYATGPLLQRAGEASDKAKQWLIDAKPNDTEDHAFHILGLSYVAPEGDALTDAIESLRAKQREDGGWSQLDEMQSDAYATGTVLYALSETGVSMDQPVMKKGLEFLLKTQHDDGSWLVESRSRPFQKYFETGFPHGTDQFISASASAWATIALLRALPEQKLSEVKPLEGTEALEFPEEDLSGRIMAGAHRFIEEELQRVDEARGKRDPQIEQSRERLKEILGVVDERLAARLQFYGDDENPSVIFDSKELQIHQVRIPVFQSVYAEGLLVRQTAGSEQLAIVIPDADQSPEDLLGLTDSLEPSHQIARRLAAQKTDVFVLQIVSRDKLQTEDRRRQRADMTQREWIYRQAFHMGRHVIGFDLQRLLAIVDWADGQSYSHIGVTGYGEGGFVAQYAAAIDPRIDAALISGVFEPSEDSWRQPIYRNIWRVRREHGNAEVAALVAPRPLIIEHSEFPNVSGHKGRIKTPDGARVAAELKRAGQWERLQLVIGDEHSVVSRFSERGFQSFIKALDKQSSQFSALQLADQRKDPGREISERRQRACDQLETHIQGLVRASEHVRDDFFLYKALPDLRRIKWSTLRQHETLPAEEFQKQVARFRASFHSQGMGKFDSPMAEPRARSRQILETEHWTAYDVVLDVHSPFQAWGVLLVPTNLRAGERRPVVVCQHGRGGVPRDTIDRDVPAYNDFAAKLAERGFITFAPHNLYRGEDQYRWLDRKANQMGSTLFSFIIDSHDQILRWLSEQAFVDPSRIAFYGLSYGGETAVRVPTVLPGYCLSICSGDFNQWTRKIAATDQPFSFMNTIEWEMPYWNLGHTFDYAEMSYLMFPRPFMVERGHHDGVGRDRWVAHEFAKVRWLYAQFGKADRVDIEFFQGGHSIHGIGTFEFLHRHLNWPSEIDQPVGVSGAENSDELVASPQ